MSTLTIELPEDLSVALQRSPRELANDVWLAAAIDWYSRGLISQGQAAEVGGRPCRAGRRHLPRTANI